MHQAEAGFGLIVLVFVLLAILAIAVLAIVGIEPMFWGAGG